TYWAASPNGGIALVRNPFVRECCQTALVCLSSAATIARFQMKKGAARSTAPFEKIFYLGAAQDRPLWGGTVPPPTERRGDIEVPRLFCLIASNYPFTRLNNLAGMA